VLQEQNMPTTDESSAELAYDDYIRKKWILQEDDISGLEMYVDFIISKMEDGRIVGELNITDYREGNAHLLSFVSTFDGTIRRNEATCQYDDKAGNTGEIKLRFVAKDEITVSFKPIKKAEATISPPEGTFAFSSDNIHNITDFRIDEKQSFGINLNSWGNVNFVSGQIVGGNHVPLLLFLVNDDGDILYEFPEPMPYQMLVKEASFEDVNDDGRNDLIVVAVGEYETITSYSTWIYFQKEDGSFYSDHILNEKFYEVYDVEDDVSIGEIRTFLVEYNSFWGLTDAETKEEEIIGDDD
jgi:hypothetical protein